jgi:integrase
MVKLSKGLKKSSLNRYIITMRSYYRFCELDYKIPLFKEDTTHKAIFSDSEIEAFLSLERPKGFRHERWHQWTVFFSVLAFSGMRASEVAQLRAEAVDFGSNNFILEHTKTTPRRVPISAILQPLLEIYIKARDDWLFPSPTKRGHVWRSGWSKHFNLRLHYLGIKRTNLTTHSFRHSFITNLWEENTSLPDIMHIVGHKKAETTLMYSHLGNKSAQKAINRHSLVKKTLDPHLQLKDIIDDLGKRGVFDDLRFEYKICTDSLLLKIKTPLAECN